MRISLGFSRCAPSVLLLLFVIPIYLVPNSFAQSGLVELIPAGPTAPPVPTGASPWGAGIQAAAKMMGWLSDQAFKSSVNSKLHDLQPDIDKEMPASGGLLIVIGIQQWKQPDDAGNYNRSVLDGYVAGPGTTPKAAMDRFLAKDRLETGPADGFVRRNIYFWKAASPKQ
jgi:hypothetical protein